MKKLIRVFLVLVCVLGLVGCNNVSDNTTETEAVSKDYGKVIELSKAEFNDIFKEVSCRKNDTYKIRITVPAGTTGDFVFQEDFIYSDEEVSPIGNKITISSGEGLGDTEVVLKPIEVKGECI